MKAQAHDQGRHLGGRPLYGYRLVDAGPHPNAAHARWGRRLQRYDPDPVTAPHVRRIFALRLAGRSTASIARELNDDGVPCPSENDRERNPHRTGEAWTLRTVSEILANPKYTGRQVWNRQRTDHDGTGPASRQQRSTAKRRWNPRSEWIVSRDIVHPPLVSEENFVAAQNVRAMPMPADGTVRRYLLTGIVRCGYCGRRMDAHWANGRPGYRCRHGRTTANPWPEIALRPLYVREDHALASAAEQLGHDHVEPPPPECIAARIRRSGADLVCTAGSYQLDAPSHGG
jgi:hypothetical protein